jgi:hypothetical protein
MKLAVATSEGVTATGKTKPRAWGYEYKSKATLWGIPLLHISFRYRSDGLPVPAVGILSIGQFGMGIVNISQFGVGVVSISQFAIAGFAVAQAGVAYSLVAQAGLYFQLGMGQTMLQISHLFL